MPFDFFFRGTLGNDVIRGTAQDDKIYAGLLQRPGSAYEINGDDILFGFAGDDFLSGGGGNDTLYGGTGNNRLHPGTGMNNVYLSGSGHDEVGTPRVDWSNPFDGRTIIHADKDGGAVRAYGSKRMHFDVEEDDEIVLLWQKMVDADTLRLRARDGDADDGTVYTFTIQYFAPGDDPGRLTPLEVDGLFV